MRVEYEDNSCTNKKNISMQEELLSLKTIEKSLAVFCLATYGEGDPTDNAMEFWDWIQGDVDLTGLNYAVSEILTLFCWWILLLCLLSISIHNERNEKTLTPYLPS